jgi:hypothetical protein
LSTKCEEWGRLNEKVKKKKREREKKREERG